MIALEIRQQIKPQSHVTRAYTYLSAVRMNKSYHAPFALIKLFKGSFDAFI